MIIIPAIDLKDAKCVRLRQGVMQDSTVFSNKPIKIAQKWFNEGAKRLHLVDLDGAFAGKPINIKIIKQIAKTLPKLTVQIGGGIRNIDTASAYIEAGISYLIIGTKAIVEPEFIKELCMKFNNKIIVGLDANNGLVATDGWSKKTTIKAIELAKKFEQYGVNSIIYTDIARDGMMNGVNIEDTKNLAKKTTIPIIASGGITNIDDIIKLKQISHYGVLGAITGRAIYEGSLDFKQAQKLAND